MSLPEESVAVNTLPEVTTIPTGKKLIFTDPDTNEGGIITLENLTKQILQNLTSQTFALDQGNLTLLQALNQLNSKSNIDTKTIAYTDDEWSALGGTDGCIKDAIDKELIPTDKMFYKQFVAGSRYLMVGYRYFKGKYGTIILYRYGLNADARYSSEKGILSRVS